MVQTSPGNKKLLVVYHSLTGGTEQMVRAFEEGASQESGIETVVRHARDANSQDVLSSQGFVFATPENLACMSGQLKDFFDRTYYDVLDRVNGRPYGIMVCAGSDGNNAARQIERIATGWRLKLVQPALIVNTHAQAPEAILAPKNLNQDQLAPSRALGTLFATALAMSIY